MTLPRIRKNYHQPEGIQPWALRVMLVGYPKPGVALVVDLYEPMYGDPTWIVFPVIDKEAGR